MPPPLPRRRGVAATESMLLLGVVAVAVVVAACTFVPVLGDAAGTLGAGVADRLGGWSRGVVPARTPAARDDCPYTFDPRTGRWHDPASHYRMVPFTEAADRGC